MAKPGNPGSKKAVRKPIARDVRYVRNLRKRIEAYTPAELEDSIQLAADELLSVNIDFYDILRGLDSYFERRKRRDADKQEAAHQAALNAAHQGDEWGGS